jgi:hypothetical protein
MGSTDHELEQAVLAMGEVREVIQDPDERKVGRALIQNWATTGDGLTGNLRRVERMSAAEKHELRERRTGSVVLKRRTNDWRASRMSRSSGNTALSPSCGVW